MLCLSTTVVVIVIFFDKNWGTVKRRIKHAGIFYRSKEELKMNGQEEARELDTPE